MDLHVFPIKGRNFQPRTLITRKQSEAPLSRILGAICFLSALASVFASTIFFFFFGGGACLLQDQCLYKGTRGWVFSAGPLVKTSTFTAGRAGSIPGLGAKTVSELSKRLSPWLHTEESGLPPEGCSRPVATETAGAVGPLPLPSLSACG